MRKSTTSSFLAFFVEWGLFLFFATFIILSRLFIWSPVSVSGHSMDPTLQDKERLIMIKTTSIDRFDIVVADEIGEDGKEIQIVKRVIGMPGDTIRYENDILYINDEETDEPYLAEYLTAFREDKLQTAYSFNPNFQTIAQNAPAFTLDSDNNPNFTIVVPEGQYLLLGDDRLVSRDGRRTGPVERSEIAGEVKLRMWPLDRIQSF